MSFIKKLFSGPPANRDLNADGRAIFPQAKQKTGEDPAGDVELKRKNRRRGTRTVLTQGEQTNLGATSGKSLLG